MSLECQCRQRGRGQCDKFRAARPLNEPGYVKHGEMLTSMELNVFPLYASANSEAREGVLNFSKTIDRFGAESLASKKH